MILFADCLPPANILDTSIDSLKSYEKILAMKDSNLPTTITLTNQILSIDGKIIVWRVSRNLTFWRTKKLYVKIPFVLMPSARIYLNVSIHVVHSFLDHFFMIISSKKVFFSTFLEYPEHNNKTRWSPKSGLLLNSKDLYGMIS